LHEDLAFRAIKSQALVSSVNSEGRIILYEYKEWHMRRRDKLPVNTKVGIAILLLTLIVLIWLCLDFCTRIV
jgi:hypothetical protein